MQFRKDTPVYTANGKHVGSLDRVVIDPANKEITHVVVSRGILFAEDHVIPVEFIETATADEVRLSSEVGDPQTLPLFQETFYVQPNEIGDRPYLPGDLRPMDVAEPLYWYPPVGGTWSGADYPARYPGITPHTEMYTKQNIPESSVGLKEGASVVSADGEQVGKVKRIFMDDASKRATHLLIAEGWLFPVQKVLPVHWIRSFDEDEIRLTVTSSVLEGLPEYEGQVDQ